MKVFALFVLFFAGCGQAPVAAKIAQLPRTGHIVTTKTVQAIPIVVCGVSLLEIAGHVEDNTGQIVPNGSYETSAFVGPGGFFIPACGYMVLDGRVCLGVCGAIHW